MWPPGARTPKVEGGGASLLKNPKAIHLYVYGPLGAKKKQGSGRSPEILTPYCQVQGISNNVRCFGASNFKMLLRNPNPQLYLAVPGLDPPRLGGGLAL